MSIPGVPSGVRSKIYRRIVERLQYDPILKGAVAKWYTWDGSPDSAGGQVIIPTPSIRLTPQLGPTTWYSPDAQYGPLQIKVEMLIRGLCADDALDLWECIERALYPADRTDELAWEASLVALGAETGQMELSQPASLQQADENQILCAGLIQIQIVRVLSP